MTIPKIKDLLKDNLYEKYKTATPSGVNSAVFLINENFVLKKSYTNDDAFRFLADQTQKRRKKMGLPEIYEKKKSGCCMYYLIERLKPVSLTEEEICFFGKMNNNTGNINENELTGKMKEIFKMVKNLDAVLFSLKGVSMYYTDFKEEHVMQNSEGKLFFIDPIAEVVLKEECFLS